MLANLRFECTVGQVCSTTRRKLQGCRIGKSLGTCHPKRHSQRCKTVVKSLANPQTEFREEDSGADAPQTKGRCYGCGIVLQTQDALAPGFVDAEKYETKRVHRQLDQLVCLRCQELSHGAMVPGVADMWVPPDGSAPRRLVSPEELRRQLADIKGKKALVVLLVDLTDASATFLGRVRDLVGQNPIILVGTKVDLLPKGTADESVAEWLLQTANHKRLNVARISLCSSRSKAGVPETVAAIRKERKGRNVYIIGAANVGKSAFTRALVREMSQLGSMQYDAAAAGAKKRLPVESAMPGTTLHMIPLRAFESGGTLYDTPGLHLHHRVQHMLSPAEVHALQPRRRLKGYIPPRTPPASDAAQPSEREGEAAGVSYTLGGLARIDVVSAPAGAHLVFFMPPALRVETIPLSSAAPHSPPRLKAPTPDPGSPSRLSSASLGASSSEDAPVEVNLPVLLEGDVQSSGGRTPPDSSDANAMESSGQSKSGRTPPYNGDANATESSGQSSKGRTPTEGGLQSAPEYRWNRSEPSAIHQGQPSEPSHSRREGQEGVIQPPSSSTGGDGDPPANALWDGRHAHGGGEAFGAHSVAARGGLVLAKEVQLKAGGRSDVADIAISGLPGWVALVAPSGTGAVHLRVWAPVGVEVFVRPSFPAGFVPAGGDLPPASPPPLASRAGFRIKSNRESGGGSFPGLPANRAGLEVDRRGRGEVGEDEDSLQW